MTTQDKKKRAFKKLGELYRFKYGKKPPTYKDDTESGLIRAILDYIHLKGYQAERIYCMGRPIPVGDGHFKMGATLMDKGTSDISAIVRSKAVKIEVKIGLDRMSSFQKDYCQKVTLAGGYYFVARSFDQFLVWWDKMGFNDGE